MTKAEWEAYKQQFGQEPPSEASKRFVEPSDWTSVEEEEDGEKANAGAQAKPAAEKGEYPAGRRRSWLAPARRCSIAAAGDRDIDTAAWGTVARSGGGASGRSRLRLAGVHSIRCTASPISWLRHLVHVAFSKDGMRSSQAPTAHPGRPCEPRHENTFVVWEPVGLIDSQSG
jgi:hypothetical protein